MKHLLNFNKFSLNELKYHRAEESDTEDYEDKKFLSYRGHVFIFDEEEWEDGGLWEEASRILNFEVSEYWDNAKEELEEHPYILIGTIEDNHIYLDGTKNYRHSPISDDLRKLSKELDMPVKVRAYRNESLDEDDFEDELIDEVKDATFYHGTCLKYVDSISKRGLMPTRTTNFDNIKHYDKIFVTTNLDKAKFHCNKASIENNSFPIILEFKIPDPSKLIFDYDVAVDILGTDNEETQRLGYSKIARKFRDFPSKVLDGDEKMDFSKKLGIYGYKGRIPASQITLLLDDELLEQYWYIFDPEYGHHDSIGYEHPMFSDMDEIGRWVNYSFKELETFTDELNETMAEENSEWDEDEDEY
jgi:hypothetical protein